MLDQNSNIEEDAAEETVVAPKKSGKPRKGKTERDHKTGAWKQRIANLADRAAWIAETRPKAYTSTESVPKMPKPHGLGNSSKRFKIKPGRQSRG